MTVEAQLQNSREMTAGLQMEVSGRRLPPSHASGTVVDPRGLKEKENGIEANRKGRLRAGERIGQVELLGANLRT